MNEKLTLNICFKYPNAKVKLTTAAEITGTYYNTKIFENIEHYFNYYDKPVRDEFISDCKLILRPSSSLTDEENKKIENMYYGEAVGGIALDCLQTVFVTSRTLDLFDYLRSINIDIDNLQERGLCIYE